MLGNVGNTGEIINQLCHTVFHSEEILGTESARNVLLNHPFLVRHTVPKDSAIDEYQFWFGRELAPFWFVVPSGKLSIQFHGNDKDFKGFTGIALAKNRYIVTLSKPLMGGFGPKAKPMAKWFIKRFGALDTSSFGARG
ncbi:MAG: hypothetical protein ACK46Q_01500 [Hyphomonas sp.]